MGILDVNGRPRSVRTEDEELRLLLQDIERLPEAEKIALKEVYAKLLEGDSEPYSGLANAEYRVAPVDIKTFLSDPYFLGETGASLWPRLADDIVELFEGEYEEATLGGSLGWGKCVTADTEVYDISSGARRRVDELGTFKTASMDARGLVSAESATAVKSGRKECVRFTLKDGRAVSMSLDHQVFTGRGWVEAGKLTANDLVAVPREMPGSDAFHEVTDAEVKLVAYLASDGGLAGSGVTFTNAQPSVLREVADCVEEVGDASRSTWGQVGTSDLGRRGKAKNIGLKGIRWFAAEMGLTCKAVDKRLPAWTYGLPKRQVALLLNRFWSCDGSVYPKKPQKAEVTLASERLIDDLQFLLSRLGVLSRKIYKASSYKDDEGKRRWFDAWRLTVTGAENILTFLHEVGDILGKEESCSALRDACSLLTPNSNTDVVPVTNDVLREMGRESGIKGLTSAYGVSGHWMGRMRFKRLCQETGYSGEKAWLAESDVAWEGVKSIENIGEQDVYDLSVENTHNFVGNGIVLHNSFFSTTAMAYTIYQMSCLKNPQRAYGIDIGSHIYVAMISVTEKVAKRVVINELIGKIRHSRYFQENFKPKEAPSQLEVRFPTNIQVVAGSTGSSAMIGLNVFSGLIDETSFLGESKKLDRHGREVVVDMGEQIYKSIIRRMKSRFQRVGRLPGVLILASSKERPSAFIEKRVHQAREVDDPMVFVREYATWDVHPAEKFSGKFFKVVVGTERISSRILSDDPEEEQRYQDLGLQIVNVPEDYRADFVSDIDGCLTGDTEIALLDGSSVPIRDLVGRDEFWTYSYGEDGRLYPGRGYDARLTHKQAEIISVLLDNGESVRCTANHLFMLRDGTYRCAGELVPGDSLMPLYRKLCKHGYEMVKSNVGGRWVHTHRIVAREALLGGCYPPEGHVIHHKDRRSKNNDPTNLEIMTEEDHRREHIKDLHRTMHSPEAKAKSAESRRKSPRCAVQRLVALEKAREVYVGSDEHRRTASKIGKRHGWGSDNENIAKARSGNGTRNITKLNRSDRNPSKKPENRRKSSERLKKMSPEKRAEVTYRGLHARWHTGDFEKCEKCMEGLAKRLCDPNNHKVVSVTQAGKEDVYDLSVDGHHNFALTVGVVVHNSLRDIAGVATDVVSQYMNRTEKVYDCQDVTLRHPVGHGDSDGPMEEWVANTPLPIQWHLIARPFKRRLPGGYEEDAWRPIRHPDAIRFAHIDTSYAGDSSGICIAHVAGWTEVVRRDSYGEEYNELAPRIETDLVLGVVPPPGDEIMLADLRGIVYQFMSHGFNVGYASLDSFQSIDTIQQLRKHGVEAEVVSIDKTTEPYDTLKTAMYEDRFRMSPHSVALREFRYLQRIPKNNGRVKIDHPKKNPDGTVGSKDVADSVAGVVYALSKKVPGMPMGIMVGTRETFDEKQDDSWVTGGRVLVQSTMSKGERQSTVDDHGGGVGVTSSLPFLKG